MKGSGSDHDGPRPGGCRDVGIKDTLNRSMRTLHPRSGRMPASASAVDGGGAIAGRCRLFLHPVAGRVASRDLFGASLTARHTNGDRRCGIGKPAPVDGGRAVRGGGVRWGLGLRESGNGARHQKATGVCMAAGGCCCRHPGSCRHPQRWRRCACAAPLCSLCLRSCPSAKPGLAAGLSLQSAHRACRAGGSPARVARGHNGQPSFTPRIGWSVCLRVCGACTFGAMPPGHALGIL